ncbi:MAG: hypothetical protein KF809_08445 [Chloroflexi bacterium]|nr:hypothetical protein [Chloroflexota bacterium]
MTALATSVALLPTTGVAVSPDASPSANPTRGDVPVVTLLDPGAEPRAELRYRYPSNADVAMTIDIDMEVRFEIDGSDSQTIDIPTVRMVALLRTGQVAADGSVRYEFEYTDMGALGDPAHPAVVAMREQFSALRGLSGWALVDDRGATLDGGIDALPFLDPTLQAPVEEWGTWVRQASAPLPAERVGVGARWQVDLRLQSQGIPIRQTMVYTIDALDGEELQLSVAVVPSAESGPISLPTAPDLAIEILEVTGSGSGIMALSLSGLVPTSEARTNVRVQVEFSDLRMTTTTDANVRIRPGAEPIPMATTLATPLPTEPIPDGAASSPTP